MNPSLTIILYARRKNLKVTSMGALAQSVQGFDSLSGLSWCRCHCVMSGIYNTDCVIDPATYIHHHIVIAGTDSVLLSLCTWRCHRIPDTVTEYLALSQCTWHCHSVHDIVTVYMTLTQCTRHCHSVRGTVTMYLSLPHCTWHCHSVPGTVTVYLADGGTVAVYVWRYGYWLYIM